MVLRHRTQPSEAAHKTAAWDFEATSNSTPLLAVFVVPADDIDLKLAKCTPNMSFSECIETCYKQGLRAVSDRLTSKLPASGRWQPGQMEASQKPFQIFRRLEDQALQRGFSGFYATDGLVRKTTTFYTRGAGLVDVPGYNNRSYICFSGHNLSFRLPQSRILLREAVYLAGDFA